MTPLVIGYVFAVLLFAGLLTRKAEAPVLKTDRRRTIRTSLVLGLTHLSAMGLPLAGAYGLLGWRLDGLIQWAGLSLLILAIVLQQWAQATLGGFFTLRLQSSQDQQIVQSGPYAWIRHPAYLAQILCWTGLGLSSGSVFATALIMVIAVAGYSYRLKEEERMLISAVGDRYRSYVVSTKRLVPGLW